MAEVIWKDVFSSNVNRLGWKDNPPTLIVEYAKGRVYEYEGVDEKLFEELTRAPSVGTALNMRVKGQFNYKRIA